MAEGEALTDGEEDPRREGAEDELRADDGKGEEEEGESGEGPFLDVAATDFPRNRWYKQGSGSHSLTTSSARYLPPPPQAQTQHKLLSVVSLLFPLRPVYLPLRQS